MNGYENDPGADEEREHPRPASTPQTTPGPPGDDAGGDRTWTRPERDDRGYQPRDADGPGQRPRPADPGPDPRPADPGHGPQPTPVYQEGPRRSEPLTGAEDEIPRPASADAAAGEQRVDDAGLVEDDRARFDLPAPSSRPARVIALANQKGGVGKTTTVINLGAALAELGYRVLLVDMDPQGSLGVGLGIEPQALEATVYDLLLDDQADPVEVIRRTDVDGLEVMPANIDLAAAELTLVQEVAREHSLRRVLDQVRGRFDFIVVDCPPSLGLLTINGLTASDGVVIPLECEYFALRGMSLLMNTIEKIQARLNPDLELLGIVATMVDTRTLHAREVLARVHEAFGDAVFKTTIRRTIRFAEAPVAGEPILTYAPESQGTDAYRDLAREVLVRQP